MEHETTKETFHTRLKKLIDEYVHLVYAVTRNFPREEIYGVTSQFRRAALSVMLNYIEGYARRRDKVHKNFLEISYGSLQESAYLVDFSLKERYLTQDEATSATRLADEIGAMLWSIISKL